MKKRSQKNNFAGNALSFIIVLLLVAVVIFVVYSFLFGKGGKGDGLGDNDTQQVMATVSETDESSVTVDIIEYIDVTVHENSYIFNNDVYEIDDIEKLIDSIETSASEKTVKVTDDNASSKAYSQLIATLDEHTIKYIEVSE